MLAGGFAAFRTTYIDSSCKADCPPGYDPVATSIVAVDLRGGRARRIDYEGALAWLGVSDTGGVAYLFDGGELRIADAAGDRLLDGEASSPAVAGSRLRWTSGGAARTTLLAGGTTCQAGVGRTRAWDDVGRAYDRAGALYACRWLRSRARRLTRAPHDHVEMAGRFVAWSEPGTVVVRDLLQGREVRPAAGAVIDLAVGGDGAVGWLESDGRLLATRGTSAAQLGGGNIEPGSLAIRRGVLFWRQDGAEVSVRIP